MKKLSFIFLMTLVSQMAIAHNFVVDGIYYNITSTEDLTVGVTYGGGYAYLGTSYSGNVTVPPSVGYDGKTYRVTSIGNEAFSKCSQLLSVSIPESVTSIGYSAFSKCTQLLSVSIPEGVTSMGQEVFRECINLVSVNIPSSITTISDRAFEFCSSLASIDFPNTVTSIGNLAFYGCTGLSQLTFPNNTSTIGNDAFSGCTNLLSVTFGNEMVSIGEHAFANCNAIASVHITDLEAWCKISFVDDLSNPLCKAHHLYLNGEEITDLQIPYGLTSINGYAFYGGSGFVSLNIPNSVTTIKRCAFSECSNLSSITIPKSVTTIDNLAFSDCSGIESLTFQNCPTLTTSDYDTFRFSSSFSGCNNIREVIFDCEKVTDILRGVKTVEAITLGPKVTAIDNNAFSGCTGLASLAFQCAPTSIGTSLFNGCTALKSVVFDCETVPAVINGISTIEQVMLKDGVTSISNDAFKGCTGIYSMTFPGSLATISSSAFSSTNLKKTIWLPTSPPTGYIYARGEVNYVMNDKYSSFSNAKVYPFLNSLFDKDGVWYVPTSAPDHTCDAIDCSYDETVKNAVIPDTVSYKGVSMTVRNIMPYLAYCNMHIDNLSIDTYGTISEDAFYGCANLKRVAIGDSISKIGKEVFYKCQNLETVLIGNSNQDSIGGCFVGMTVKDVGVNAFAGCNIKKLCISDRDDILSLTASSFGSSPIKDLYLGGDISFFSSPFYQNTSLQTVIINDKETEITSLEFYGCTNLQSVRMGNGVKAIGNKAFSGCSSLKSFSVGRNVKSIGQNAFFDCTSLVEFTIKATVPPTCDTQALESINKWECKLIVPEDSKADYQSAEQWKEFFFIEEKAFVDDTPDKPGTQKCETPTINYAEGRLSLVCATEGAECVWSITSSDVRHGRGDTIDLANRYMLTVYATKEGWEDSDRVTVLLVWGDDFAESDNVIRLGGSNGGSCDVNQDGTVDVADIASIISEMAARARQQKVED